LTLGQAALALAHRGVVTEIAVFLPLSETTRLYDATTGAWAVV
jgi:hypothetical protein